jgi:hypothetical protein
VQVAVNGERPAPAAFYCVSSAAYFLGAVGMINSLRLLGHDEPVFVMDCGLTVRQREVLDPHVNLVPAPEDREPFTLKAVLPLARPAETMVLIDTDVIVTSSLGPLISEASRGRVVAFRNHADRFADEWAEMLDLAPLPRRPYLCSGLVALGRSPGTRVLELLDDRQGRIDYARSYFGAHDPGYPLLYADQDVLNAVLASRVDAERVVALDHRLAPMTPFEGVEVIDERRLHCAYADGTDPYLLHHSLSPKPWQHPSPEGPYTRLLRRALSGPDVEIALPAAELPRRLRAGALRRVEGQVRARERLRRLVARRAGR